MSVSGFTGADCSVVADSPPIVGLLVSQPTCNMRENKCNSFRVIAENFDMLTPITCKLVRIQLGDPTADAYAMFHMRCNFFTERLINVDRTA